MGGNRSTRRMRKGKTALHYAASNDHYDGAVTLLQCGALLDSSDLFFSFPSFLSLLSYYHHYYYHFVYVVYIFFFFTFIDSSSSHLKSFYQYLMNFSI